MELPPVSRTVTVNAPADAAFRMFAAQMGTWWPNTHRLLPTETAEVVVEETVGGRWYERSADGAECDWGRVLAYDPPRRLLLAWHIDGTFAYDPDPAHASEVEISFADAGDGATRVTLEHRGIERHGATAENAHAAVSGADGWTGVMESFTKAVATA